MRNLCLIGSTLVTLAAVTAAFSQRVMAQETAILVSEHDSNTVRVGSPNVLVGIVTATPEAADPTLLTVFAPFAGTDSLCIDLVSDDGQYEGRFTAAPSRFAGRRTIRLPTRLAGTLRRYGPARLSPLAYLSRRCPGDPGRVLAAGWGPGASPSRLRLLLNPTDAAEVMVRPGGTEQPVRCVRLRQPRQVAYDYECEVDMSTLRGERMLSIVQHPMFGLHLPSIPVRIWVADVQ